MDEMIPVWQSTDRKLDLHVDVCGATNPLPFHLSPPSSQLFFVFKYYILADTSHCQTII